MRVKYLIGAVLTAAIVVFAIIVSGGNVMVFVDVPSIIVVVLIPAAIAFASWPVKDIGRAFSAPFDKAASKPELAKSILFFGSIRRWSLESAILGTLLGLVCILKFMTDFDKDRLGANLAVMLLCLTTALILSITVSLPLEAIAKRRISELD